MGETYALRELQSLDLFICEKPSSHIEKQHNKETLQLANSIKNKKDLDIKSGIYGFNSYSKSNSNFIGILKNLQKIGLKQKETMEIWDMLKHLIGYTSISIIFKNIDKEFFVKDLKNYLIYNVSKKNGKAIKFLNLIVL